MRKALVQHILEIAASAAPKGGLHAIVLRSGFKYDNSRTAGNFAFHNYTIDPTKADRAIQQLNAALVRGMFPAMKIDENDAKVWSRPGHKFTYANGLLQYRVANVDAAIDVERIRKLVRANERDHTTMAGTLKSTTETDDNIGRTWESHEGVRKVEVIYTRPDGSKLYGVSTDGSRSQDLFRPEDLEREIASEVKRGIANKAFQEKQNAEQAKREIAEKARLSLDGFEDTIKDKMLRGRVIKTLTDKGMYVNKVFYQCRRDAIRELVKQGYVIDHNSNGRILTSNDPERGHFVEKDFTKYGLDYAEYLLKQKKRKTTASAPMIRYEFIYRTDNDDDDGYRVIMAPDMQTARDMFKKQMQAEGQKVRVEHIKGTPIGKTIAAARPKIQMTMPDTYEAAMQHRQELDNAIAAASKALKRFPKGNMGLTPDAIKFSPEYIAAKRAYQMATDHLRAFNAVFLKKYKKEYAADADQRRANHKPVQAAAATWHYHSTSTQKARKIAKQGLMSSEWEDEEIDSAVGAEGIWHLLFFTDRPQDEYGEVQLRFAHSALRGVKDTYSSDRGSFYWSDKQFVVPPNKLEIKRGGTWTPLVAKPTIAAPADKDTPLHELIQQEWEAAIGGTSFILNKLYPIVVRFNGVERRFGGFKSSGSGPLKLQMLFKTKLGPEFRMYRLGTDGNLTELGRRSLVALTEESQRENIKEFEAIFKNKRRPTIASKFRAKIKMTPALQAKTEQAAIFGAAAFKAGKKCVPAQDANLMKLLEGLPVGGGSSVIMKAWSDAWTKKNLSTASIETIAAGKVFKKWGITGCINPTRAQFDNLFTPKGGAAAVFTKDGTLVVGHAEALDHHTLLVAAGFSSEDELHRLQIYRGKVEVELWDGSMENAKTLPTTKKQYEKLGQWPEAKREAIRSVVANNPNVKALKWPVIVTVRDPLGGGIDNEGFWVAAAMNETLAAPPKHEDIAETLRAIFRKAGTPMGRRDAVKVQAKSGGGWIIHISTDHTTVSFKGMMRLRAYLTHYFKAKTFSVAPVVQNGKSFLRYSITVKEIKRDKEGNRKLIEKNVVPIKRPPPKKAAKKADKVKKPSKVKKPRTMAMAAFARIEAHTRNGIT